MSTSERLKQYDFWANSEKRLRDVKNYPEQIPEDYDPNLLKNILLETGKDLLIYSKVLFAAKLSMILSKEGDGKQIIFRQRKNKNTVTQSGLEMIVLDDKQEESFIRMSIDLDDKENVVGMSFIDTSDPDNVIEGQFDSKNEINRQTLHDLYGSEYVAQFERENVQALLTGTKMMVEYSLGWLITDDNLQEYFPNKY
jgi:hypothetical protein